MVSIGTVLQPLVLVLVLSTLGSVAVGLLSLRFVPMPGARPLAALMAATTVWSVGSVYSLLTVSMAENLLATRVAYLGISLVPVAWLALALEYAGRESWLTPRTVGGLCVLPALTQFVAWGPHHLLWRVRGTGTLETTMSVAFEYDLLGTALVETWNWTVGPFVVLDLAHGPWFWVHTTYSYGLLAAGTVVFLGTVVDAERIYRRQVTLVLVAALVPLVTNVFHVVGASPLPMDPTPFTFAVSGGLFFVAMFRFRLLDVVPIARDAVLDEMADGVVVLDHEDRVVDVNPRAAELVGVDPPEVVGRPAGDVFPAEYVDRYATVTDGRDRITVEEPDRQRVVDLRISPLRGRDDSLRGRVVILRDVTVQHRQRSQLRRKNEQLQRQNEQLDRFASILSHDLRNPLDAARSRLDLLRAECDSEHVPAIAEAHERMAELIDDVLVLAREGREVGTTAVVSVGTVVEAARSVSDPSVTVEVDDDLPEVRADPARLQQLFENLLRNAEDHAGPDATVRVGPLEDGRGFYVEDDGPGIPPGERDRVFESGYSLDSSGTGLGLAIVRTIVLAHGWTIDATEGGDGGARFEVVTRDPDRGIAGPDRAATE